MARATLDPLIARLRLMISDQGAVETAPVFSDDDLADFLDEQRSFSSREILSSQLETDGRFREFLSAYPWWEEGASLWQADPLPASPGVAVAPDIAEPLRGRWRINAGVVVTLSVTGSRYDLHGAAASALNAWIARIKLEYDLSASGDSWARSQKITHLERLRDQYQEQSLSGVGAGGALGRIPIARADWRGW